MNNDRVKIWNGISIAGKREILNEVAVAWNLPSAAIEKDWWVVRTLDLVFQTEIAPHTVFKGGTSLSKAWGLIDRFSEDIDLALDRKFLGFDKEMTSSQVKKLRESSFKYISEKFFPLLQKKFQTAGFNDVALQLRETTSNDQDPLIIEVNYPGLADKAEYLQPRVLIEIGSRSMKEPFTEKEFCSFVGEQFKGREFADGNIVIPTVNPERTFLEKIFLLHEEFQQSAEKMRIDRKTRHPYDLERIMDTAFAAKAMADKELYHHIVEHRKTITPLRGIDYANHIPAKINIIPPDEIMAAWKKDYEQMQESMIYTPSPGFEKLMERMALLNGRINKITL